MLDVKAIFIYVIAVQYTSSTPTVIVEPISISVLQNTGVSFKCTVTLQDDLRTVGFRFNDLEDFVTFYYSKRKCSFYGSSNSTLYAWRCGNTPGEHHLDIFHTTEEDNNGKFKCVAIYGAGTNENSIQVMGESLITVLVPISNVSITPSSAEIYVGNNQTFTCTTDAGRPNANIKWFLSDGTNITASASQHPDCGSGCNDKVTSTSILMYTGTRVDHGKFVYCKASNVDGRSVRSQNAYIEILFGPEVIQLVPSTSSYTVTETTGKIGPITCTADCRPNCTVEWSGPNLPDGATSVLSLQNINRNQAGNYSCTAKNKVGNLISGTITIIIQYGPSSVVLTPPTPFYKVEETSGIGPIRCTADCRPYCIITWSGPNLPGGTTSTLTLLDINRNQTGHYYCTAINTVNSTNSTTVAVIVNYGPSFVVLSPSTPSYTVIETTGSVGPITCTADCRPNCTMTWNGPTLSDDTTSELNLQNINRNQAGYYRCTASNTVNSSMSGIINVTVQYGPYSVVLLPSTTPYIVTESFGSIGPIKCTSDCIPYCTMTWHGPLISDITTSILNLRNTYRNVTGDYFCTASNSIGNLTSGIIRVIVNYGPAVIIVFPSTPSYIVTENTGSIGPITCTADCRPNCTMIWSGPNLPGTASVLNFQNINRNQAGEYQCIANNSVDSQMSEKIKVIVNYVPTILSIDGNTTYTENDTAEFRCYVDSLPQSIIMWKLMDGNNITILPMKQTPNYNVNGSTLTVSHMNCLSMGQYVCEAVNEIGNTSKIIEVSVMCAPRLNTIEYEIRDRIAVKDNEPLNITVPVLAYPAPWIYWGFIRNDSYTNTTGYIVNTISLNRYYSVLFILNMTQDNFGTYAIYAGNGVWNNNRNCIGTFEVKAARRPIKPSNITCSAGHNYLIVNWKPEYNGGSPQSFQVLYKRNTEEPFKSHPENVSETDYRPVKVGNLLSSDMYFLKVHTTNIYNTTESNVKICNTTTQEMIKDGSQIAVGVGAGVGSATVVIIVVFIVLFLFRRLRTKTTKHDKEPMQRSNEDEENDELKDNPLYVSSSNENVVPQSGICSKVSGVKTIETCTTSQTKKKKKAKSNIPIELGCVYENHDDFLKENDQIYANQVDTENSCKEYKPKKNQDGLIYADLDLAPVSKERMFVIRGLDNRNNYAIIDLSKKADPLPSDDDDEERKSNDNGR